MGRERDHQKTPYKRERNRDHPTTSYERKIEREREIIKGNQGNYKIQKRNPYSTCLNTYLGSSATQAMCASWQSSTIADMQDIVI
jgi:hypothetical protein